MAPGSGLLLPFHIQILSKYKYNLECKFDSVGFKLNPVIVSSPR